MIKKIISFFLIFSFIMFSNIQIFADTDFSKTDVDMFKDVPKNHWAYDAIFELRQDGIMIGYENKKGNIFDGEKPLTRYEFALSLAKAIKKIEENIRKENKNIDIEQYLKEKNVNNKDIELLIMLTKEFKKELNALNVRVTKLEDNEKDKNKNSLPLYLSIIALIISMAAFTISLQK